MARRYVRRKKKRRLRPRFILTLLVIFGVLAAVLYGAKGGFVRTAAVEWGPLESRRAVSAVIVRDEEVFSAEDYGKVVYYAAEGEKVSKDALLAEIFKTQYTSKNQQDHVSSQQAVLNAQKTLLKDIVSDELNKVSETVQSAFLDVEQAGRSGDASRMLALERKLDETLENRKEEYRKYISADDALNDLYHQADELDKKQKAAKTEVLAPYAGVVSFYLDGCEEALNKETLETLSYSRVKSAVADKKSGTAARAGAASPLFRVVNDAQWYVLILSDEEEDVLLDQQQVTLTFEGTGDTVSGTCVDVRREENGALYVVELTGQMGARLSQRKCEVTLGRQMTGFRIPLSSITHQGGVPGVIVVSGQDRTFVPVHVLVEDGKTAIVETVDADSVLEVDQQVKIG